MRIVKLTGVANPDLDNGQASSVLVDVDRIVYVERALMQMSRASTHEEYRQLLVSLYDETERVVGVVKGTQVKAMNIDTDNQVAMRNWHTLSEAAGDLKLAYSLMNSVKGPWFHPQITCTTIGLAYGNDSGTGALARLHVQESIEEVHEAIGKYLFPTPPDKPRMDPW